MQGRESRLIGTLALGLACLAAGFLVGSWFRSGPAAQAAQEDAAPGHAAILARIEALQRAVDERLEQRDERAVAPVQPPAGRSVAEGGPPEEDAELREILSRIERRLDELSPGAGGAAFREATSTLKGAGCPSIAGMHQQMIAVRNSGGWESVVSGWQRSHALWTANDVVERYGPPTRIETDNGLELFYGGLRLGEETCEVRFQLAAGYVSAVDFNCQ